MKIKAIISVILVLVLSLSLISCDRVTKNEAKETTESFLSAIASGDFESAKGYLHPEKPVDLEKYFDLKELQGGIDFQKGIEITRYTEYSSSLYDSDVDGSDYELEMNITVDGQAIEMTVDIVRNDLGYGIYEFEIDLDNLGLDD